MGQGNGSFSLRDSYSFKHIVIFLNEHSMGLYLLFYYYCTYLIHSNICHNICTANIFIAVHKVYSKFEICNSISHSFLHKSQTSFYPISLISHNVKYVEIFFCMRKAFSELQSMTGLRVVVAKFKNTYRPDRREVEDTARGHKRHTK